MSYKNYLFGCCISAIAFAEVTSWTIDLPEVRKYLFKKNEMEKVHSDVNVQGDQVFYSNIEGNSMHNAWSHDSHAADEYYAKEYGYQPYMEKKVQDIVHNGSVYLEGLRRAIENYTEFLQNCSRANFTAVTLNETETTFTSARPPPLNSSDVPLLARMSASCRAATRASEHVRRLAELATWATGQLQDLAFANSYQKDHDDGREENELILKLAWFLDRLAHLTGYEPEPQQFVSDEPLSTTTTPAPTQFSLMNAPEQVNNAMMNCLESNSSEPATERCAYPLPLPPLVQQIYNFTGNSTTPPQSGPGSAPDATERVLPMSRGEPVPEQSMELLVTADDRTSLANFHSILTGVNVKPVRKRSASRGMSNNESKLAPISVHTLRKRSIDENPSVKIMKYFVKHKVWVNSNPIPSNRSEANKNKFQELDVKNHLTVSMSVQKRSLYSKKYRHMRLPEDPSQNLNKYLKHKPGVNYEQDQAQLNKIRAALEKYHSSKHSTAAASVQKLKKLVKHMTKRSVEYEAMKLPRVSEDPMQDLSYYVKNRPGTGYNEDAAQAARLRLALTQVFATGNIEVVRRFGSNYNPLNPQPFYVGLAKSMADV